MGPPGPVSGPAYLIPDTVGQIRGANLFHSFSFFNIGSGESATFTGPAAIDNVVSRVTGGSPSSIDGFLRSTIPSADLWFINPAGVVFGQDASLDVDGSFHVSTADYLRLGGGGRFDATTPSNSVLTTSPPEAFGFLGPNPAGIRINHATLEVPEGETFSIVGGDIEVTGGTLKAAGGRFNLVSTKSAGDVQDFDVSTAMERGEITLTDHALIDASGAGGGAIQIRGGRLYMSEANVFADTTGPMNGRGISVVVDALEMRKGSALTTDSLGSGRGGDLRVDARSIVMAGDSASFVTGISSRPLATGNGGSVTLNASDIEIRDGAQVSVTTFAAGNGGNLEVKAGSIRISGVDTASELPSGLFAGAQGLSSGNSGSLTIDAQELVVSGGGQISTGTFSAGHGGNLRVDADEVMLSGFDFLTGIPSGIFVSTESRSSGDAGQLTIVADALDIRDGARISARTFGSGDAGEISVNAGTITLSGWMISVSGGVEVNPSGIFAGVGAGGTGNAGSLTVSTQSLNVLNGAQVNAINSGPGRGGAVQVDADSIRLAGVGGVGSNGVELHSGIVASAAVGSSGDAGSLTVTARSLDVSGGAEIRATNSGPGGGGSVKIHAGDVVLAGVSSTGSRSGIFTSSSTGTIGDAGSLDVVATSLEVRDGAQISSTTAGSGRGGDLYVKADNILLSGVSEAFLGLTGINASTSGQGNAGSLTIEAGSVEVRDGAEIIASTFGPGDGGDVEVNADRILLSGAGGFGLRSGIYASANKESDGDAGSLKVTAKSLEVSDGAQISAVTSGKGNGGEVVLNIDNIALVGVNAADGNPSRIVVAADGTSSGNAGSLTVDTVSLEVRDGAQITAETFGVGHGGNIKVDAGKMLLSGTGGAGLRSGIYASAAEESTGVAGSVRVDAGSLELRDGAQISTSTAGSGAGGQILINAGSILMLNGSAITADSTGSGLAGNVIIDAGERFESHASTVSSKARSSDGGNIRLTADDLILLVDSSITTSVGSGEGSGGRINIDPQFVILLNSQIIANAFGGPGGTIDIVAGNFFKSPDSKVEAFSHQAGINGTVTIESPDTDVSGSLAVLPENFLDAAALFAQRCGVQSGSGRSSLVMGGQRLLPPEPGGFLISTTSPESIFHRFAEDSADAPTAVSSPGANASAWRLAAVDSTCL